MNTVFDDHEYGPSVYFFIFTVYLPVFIGLPFTFCAASSPLFITAAKWLFIGLLCLTLFVIAVIYFLIRHSFVKHRSFLEEYRVLEKRISPVNLNPRFVFEQKMKFLEIITVWKKTGETFDRAAAVLWQKKFKARFYKLEYFVPHY